MDNDEYCFLSFLFKILFNFLLTFAYHYTGASSYPLPRIGKYHRSCVGFAAKNRENNYKGYNHTKRYNKYDINPDLSISKQIAISIII